MLLQRLREYSFRGSVDMPPTLYARLPVRYIVELDATGRPTTPSLTDTADASTAASKRGERRFVPSVVRSSGIQPLLLADKASYALGVGSSSDPVQARRGQPPRRADEEHASFVELVRTCAQTTADQHVGAVLLFLEHHPLSQLELGDDFNPKDKLTFRVAGDFVVDRRSVQEFWAAKNDPAAKGAKRMQCLVCGRGNQAILKSFPEQLKGIPGGQSSGTALVSANAKAFESYGQERSETAPTCADCAGRFTKSLNAMLADPVVRVVVGNTVFVCWTREPVEFNVFTCIRDPEPAEVKALLQSVSHPRSGGHDPDEIGLYVLGLSVSPGNRKRAVVRDWIDSTLGEVKSHLARWFAGQEVVGPWGDEPRLHGLFALAASTVRDARKDLSPGVVRALMESAIRGAPIPPQVLQAAVRRSQIEGVTAPRAALIKLALSTSDVPSMKGAIMSGLDESSSSVAYHCGRLLAVMEEAQQAAIHGIKNTVADRFFSSASSTPGATLPRLLQGGRHHLTKLKRDYPGAGRAIDEKIEQIQAMIDDYPRTLGVADQGRFALGYYHQRASDRAQRKEAAARKKAGSETTKEAELALLVEESEGGN